MAKNRKPGDPIPLSERRPPPQTVVQRLAGALPEHGHAVISELLERGWKTLSEEEQEVVLVAWVGQWKMDVLRKGHPEGDDPQPAAITLFESRLRTRTCPTLTYDERDKLLADEEGFSKTARLALELAFAIRAQAAIEEVDRAITYQPKAPDRTAIASDITARRAHLQQQVGACRQSENGLSAAALLGLIATEKLQVFPSIGIPPADSHDLLAWDDIRARDPKWLDELALRLAMVAMNLGDAAQFAPGIPIKPDPGKKRNTPARALLANLDSLGLANGELAQLKRRAATIAVKQFNIRHTGVRLIDLQRTTATVTEQEIITQSAIDAWVTHFQKIKDSAGRRLKSV